MKPFKNKTDQGNENAIRRGRVVPDGGVNLAWARSPQLSPDKNIIIVDTSRVVEENNIQSSGQRKLMYANGLGILEDAVGNQLIDDEYPVVSDTFVVDEDFSVVPGNEYTDADVLPFVHRSRHLHIDFAGLVLNHDLLEYKGKAIKVVDSKGREYLDAKGKARYKIKITTAFANPANPLDSQGAYRVYAYVDVEDNEDLYLLYNKIDIDGQSGHFKNHELNYKELLNPVSYYKYTPEESEVVDPANRKKQIYSTKPISLKHQILNEPVQGKDGFRIFVPKKALSDPRIFQLFRWRVTCTFTQKFKVDPNTGQGIRAGVLITNANPHSKAPYAFLNLSRSAFNASGLSFYNPLATSQQDPETASYWYVNLDTVSDDDLRKFDVLIFAPSVNQDFIKYYSKITAFVYVYSGTLLVDTSNSFPLEMAGNTTSSPVSNSSGRSLWTNEVQGKALFSDVHISTTDSLFDADNQLGGWDFNDGTNDEYNTLTAIQGAYGNLAPATQFFTSTSLNFNTLISAKVVGGDFDGQYAPILMKLTTGRGRLIVSTMDILGSCSKLFSNVTNKLVSQNEGATLARFDDYRLYVNAPIIEGAMKFLYNVSLESVADKVLDSTDERSYSSTWTFATDWKSSWVINAGHGVLDDHEIQENDFVFLPKDLQDPTPVWQRKLLYGDKSKTMKELMDAALTPDMRTRIQGAHRKYVIEVTNSKVSVPTTLGDDSYPYAWTEAFSPKFSVPVELGPHVVKAEDVKARFEAGQYMHRTYPSKPYSGQVRTVYTDTQEINEVNASHWTATGTATETITTGTYVPPSSHTVESEVALDWSRNGAGAVVGSGWLYEFGAPQPQGITTWQNWNYYNSAWGTGILNWPHYGIYGQWGLGSSGDVVAFVQDALNFFAFFGLYDPGTDIPVDGYYGYKTRTAVTNFQSTFGARYIDGIVDAETLSIIGAQTLRMEPFVRSTRTNDGFYTWYFQALERVKRSAISDGNPWNVYDKRSWLYNGPSTIWEMFQIQYNQVYPIHGVTFIPHVEGDTDTLMFRSIDIRTQPTDLQDYDSRNGDPIYMPYRPRDGEAIYVPFNVRYGDTLVIGIGQDNGTGIGTSRMLGVRDVVAHARVSTTVTDPGKNTITKQYRNIAVHASGTAFVSSRTDTVINLIPNYVYTGAGTSELSNISWTSFTQDNPNVLGTLATSKSGGSHLTLRSNLVDTEATTSIVTSQRIPENVGTYYWMNDQGVKSGLIDTGMISKADGLKILCDANKKPIGFPTSLPTNVGPNEAQRHYASLSLITFGNDATVQMGFYDFLKKEFIVNPEGKPEMTFIEYQKRGPQNIYIAVISTYEVDTTLPLPSGEDAPPLPFKWAMPVYGIYKRAVSKIALEALPANLNSDDVWPIGIRTGKFTRRQALRSKTAGPLSGYYSKYQGTNIEAFYAIPEADRAGWSSIYGPPNYDVKDEQPLIIDTDLIQVRQAPIYMVEVPTVNPSHADPVRPVFQVYHRITRSDPWVEVPLTAIRDYNVSTGEIYLSEPMEDIDEALWKVSYTTSRRIFHFKEYAGTILNLNPYLPYSKQFTGKGIYIYIVPEFVRDKNGATIPQSVVSSTLRFTLDPTVFDPISPNYDPLAIQLGVMYLSTALDIKDLTILDTRRRGGGGKDEANASEIVRLVSEASHYWDLNYGSGLSYQKGGFVIVRLPAELKSSFSEAEIVDAIERNITVGVQFKVEDLSGRDWSDV